MDVSTVDYNTTNDKQAAERLQTLYSVHDTLKQVEAEGLNINSILPQVLKIAARQLDAPDGSIIVVNQNLEIEHVWFAQGTPTQTFIDDIMSHGLAGWVIRQQKPYIITDTRTDEHWLPRPGHVTTVEPWSVICTPFITHNRAIGALTIHKAGINQFDEQDLNLLAAISNQAAATIENARLFEQSQRQLQVSALLYEASKVINSSLDINEIMQHLLSQMNELLHAEAISIALVDKQSNELVYQVAAGIGSEKIVDMRLPSNQGISGWVMEHNEPVLVNDTQQDPRFYNRGDKRTGYSTRAMICAPMQSKKVASRNHSGHQSHQKQFHQTRPGASLIWQTSPVLPWLMRSSFLDRRLKARYMNLFQDSIDPIIITDLSGIIVEANRNAFIFLGINVANYSLKISLTYIP
ncbi:MAG: GAF domain-containing protein [Chloroflexota bacterium]